LCGCQKTEAPLVRRALVWQKEPLTRHHDRASFDCGVSVLNRYRQPTAWPGAVGPYTFRSTLATPAGAGLASIGWAAEFAMRAQPRLSSCAGLGAIALRIFRVTALASAASGAARLVMERIGYLALPNRYWRHKMGSAGIRRKRHSTRPSCFCH
jgi:hypothetical protein